jgi:hypothetical protein
MKMTNEWPKIIVEIPHRFPPIAWIAFDEEQIINAAYETAGLIYEKLDKEDLIRCYGDWIEVPQEEKEIIEKYGEIYHIGWRNESRIYSPKEAETQIDTAIEALGHDLHQMVIMNVQEAKDFVSGKSNEYHISHNYFGAVREIRKKLEILQ